MPFSFELKKLPVRVPSDGHPTGLNLLGNCWSANGKSKRDPARSTPPDGGLPRGTQGTAVSAWRPRARRRSRPRQDLRGPWNGRLVSGSAATWKNPEETETVSSPLSCASGTCFQVGG